MVSITTSVWASRWAEGAKRMRPLLADVREEFVGIIQENICTYCLQYHPGKKTCEYCGAPKGKLDDLR